MASERGEKPRECGVLEAKCDVEVTGDFEKSNWVEYYDGWGEGV